VFIPSIGYLAASQAEGAAAGVPSSLVGEDSPIAALGSSEGSHFWIATPWAMIRGGGIHRLFEAWDLRWTQEVILPREPNPHTLGLGDRTALLILAVRGDLPLLAAWDDVMASATKADADDILWLPRIIERMSPEPRIMMSPLEMDAGWDGCRG
jgi:hypothetical protein